MRLLKARERERERETEKRQLRERNQKRRRRQQQNGGGEVVTKRPNLEYLTCQLLLLLLLLLQVIYTEKREREREGGNIVKALSVPVSAKSRSESKIPDRHKRKKRNERWPSSAAKNIEGTTKNCITQYCIKKSNTIREMVTFFPTVLIGSHAGL